MVELLPEMLTTRHERLICPNCRSTLQIRGVPDPGAYSLQSLYCLVCGQQLFIPAARFVFPRYITYTWVMEKVIKRGPEPIPKPQPAIKIPQDKFWVTVSEQAWSDIKNKIFKFGGYGIIILTLLYAGKRYIDKKI